MNYQSILQYWLKKTWVCTLIFTHWSSCFLEIAVDFWIVAHFQDQVDIIWILEIIVKLKNNRMMSVIVYNKTVTCFKATIILKISQLKVKFSIIVTCTVHYFRPRDSMHSWYNYQEFVWLNLNNATHVAFSQVLI